jgi:hypothetical protein
MKACRCLAAAALLTVKTRRGVRRKSVTRCSGPDHLSDYDAEDDQTVGVGREAIANATAGTLICGPAPLSRRTRCGVMAARFKVSALKLAVRGTLNGKGRPFHARLPIQGTTAGLDPKRTATDA